ncbi:MAG: ATP synthase F0 subunit B [Candidatus Aminicenantales bacterium]
MLQIDATFIVIFFVVWILVFILSRVFWKPMVKVVRDRESQVRGDKESFEKSTEACKLGLLEIDKTLTSARAAAEKARDGIEIEALKEKSRIIAEAGSRAKDEIEKAKAELQAEIFRLKRELEIEAERLAGRIEQRLLN